MDAQRPAWVWERLWEAAAAAPGTLRVAVAPTLLFTAGVPSRWVDYVDGRTAARAFADQAQGDRDDGSLAAALASSEERVWALVRARVAEALAGFAAFARRFDGGASPPTVAVTYADGSADVVPADTAAALCEHGEWRGTVALLQPALPPGAAAVVVPGLRLLGVPVPRAAGQAEGAGDGASGGDRRAPSQAALAAVGTDYAGALATALAAGGGGTAAAAGDGAVARAVTVDEADALAAELAAAVEATFILPDGSGSGAVDAPTTTSAAAHAAATARSRGAASLRVACLVATYARVPAGGSVLLQPLLTLTRNLAQGSAASLAGGGGGGRARARPPPAPAAKSGGIVPSAPSANAGGDAHPHTAPPLELTGGEAKKAALAEADRAACSAHAELQRLVGDALAAGVPLVEVWAHFDPAGDDVIDERALRRGLGTLGIHMHDLPFAALAARIQARHAVDDRDPALRALAKVDPFPIKRFGPAEFFAFLQRDPGAQFLPPPPKPALKSTAAAIHARLLAAQAATASAAVATPAAAETASAAADTLTPSATAATAATPAASSAADVADAYTDAKRAYQALAAKLTSALTSAGDEARRIDQQFAPRRPPVDTAAAAANAVVASAGTLTAINVPPAAYDPGAASALPLPDDVLEARALPDAFFSYRASIAGRSRGGGATLAGDARPVVVGARKHLSALLAGDVTAAAAAGSLLLSPRGTGGGSGSADTATNGVDALVSTYAAPFRETKAAAARSDAEDAAACRRQQQQQLGRRRGSSGGAARRHKSTATAAGGLASAEQQQEASLRLSYNLPRASPVPRPASLLPPRARRRASLTGSTLQRYGAADGSDAATVRQTTPEQRHHDGGYGSSSGSFSSGNGGTVAEGSSAHHYRLEHLLHSPGSPPSLYPTPTSDGGDYDGGAGADADDGPSTFPRMRRTSLGSDGAGTGNGALGAGGLYTSAAASPFLPGASSVDGETGALRGGLFDPEAIRRLGVPQVGLDGSGFDGDGLSLRGGGLHRGGGATAAATYDDGIDDRFLVPGAVPALSSNGQPQAFIDDADATPTGSGLHQRDEGRRAVVAELRRRGLPTDDGATELEMLERLEAALDGEAAHTAAVAERLKLQSEQRKRTATAATAAAASNASDGSRGFSAELGDGNAHSTGSGCTLIAGPGALTATATQPLAPQPADPVTLERRRQERARMASEDDRSRRLESWAGALVALGHDTGDYAAALAGLAATMAPEEVALLSLAVDRAAEQRGALQASSTQPAGAAADAVAAAAADARRANAAKFAALRAQAAVEAIVLPGEAAGYALDLDSPVGRAQAAGVLRRLCGHLAELRGRRATAEAHFRRAAVKLRRRQMELVCHRVQAAVVGRGLAAASRDRDAIRDALTRAGVPAEAADANHQLRVAAAETAELAGHLAHEQALLAYIGDELGVLMVTAAGFAAALAYFVRRCGEKEAALRAARAQLAVAITATRAAARESKDAQEAHAHKLLALTAHVADARRRLNALRAERVRLRHVTARYVDTAVLASAGTGAAAVVAASSSSADAAGALQRVETDGLRAWLADEILRQKLETADAEAQQNERQRTVARLQAAYTAAHDDVVTLSRWLRAAVEALKSGGTGARSGLAVDAMLARLFDVQSVVAHAGRRGGALAGAAAADAGGKASTRVDLTDVFGPAPGGGAQLCDEEADALDEDAATAEGGSGGGGVGGASTGSRVRGAAGVSGRDAAVLWRAQQLSRGIEVDAYVTQMLADVGDDERALGALGLTVQPAPSPWAANGAGGDGTGGGWYTSAARTLALADRPATVLGPTAATTSAAAAAAAVTAAAAGDMLALLEPPLPPAKGAASALAVSAALAGTGASAPDPTFDLTGYASPAALEGGMHAVLGAPAEPATSAFPFAHAPPAQPSFAMARLPTTAPVTANAAPFRVPRLTAGLSIGGAVGNDDATAVAAGSSSSSTSLPGLTAAASTAMPSAAPPWATSAEPSSGADTISLPLTFPLHPPPGTRGRLWSAGSIGSTLSSRRGSRLGRGGAGGGGGGWAAGLAGSLSLGGVGSSGLQVTAGCKLGALVRWLPASARSVEQKQWVALDRRLWPQRYARVSAEDERLYSLDPAYKCEVPRGTLLRLLALPASPAQALPYLRSPAEVRLHSLLARYSHGLGEEVERLRDQEAGARAVAMAAVARGYVARIKPPHARTAEEADWVALDVLVRPHLYTATAAAAARAPTTQSLQRRQTPPLGAGDVPPASRGVFSGFNASGAPAAAAPPLALATWRDSRRVSVSSDAADDADAAAGGAEPHPEPTSAGADDDLSLQRNRAAVGGFGGYVRRTLARLLDYDGRRRKARSDSYDGLRRDAAAAAASKAAAQAARRTPTGRRSRNSRSAVSAAATPRNGSARLVTAAPAAGGTSASSAVLAAALAASQPATAATAQPPPPPPTGLEQIAAFERGGGQVTRPEPGVLADGYSRDDLLALMATRAADLTSDRDRRAQLLLRAYGSDGGEALYRAALRRVTPVVGGLGDVADALDATSKELAAAGGVDYASELGQAYPDGDASNVAAVAVQAVTAGVLVRAQRSREVLCVIDAPLRPGMTADHSFEVPGSLADVVVAAGASRRQRQLQQQCQRQQARPPSSSGSSGAAPRPLSASKQQRPPSAARPGSARPPPQTAVQPPSATTTAAPTTAATEDAEPALTTPAEIETGCPGASPVAVDLTVTVVFHGAFLDKAYALGKLTACLYREPAAPEGQPPLTSTTAAAFAADGTRPSSASRRGAGAAPAVAAGAAATGPEGVPAVKPSAAVRQALLRPLDVDPAYLAQQVARHGDTAPIVLTEAGAFLGWARDEDEAVYLEAAAGAGATKGTTSGGYDSDPGADLRRGASSSSSGGRAGVTSRLSVTRAGTAAAAAGWQPYEQLPALSPAQATANRNRRFKRRGRVIASGALAGLEATMELKRKPGWYVDDARRQLQEMGATIAALPPPLPSSRQQSSSRSATASAAGRRRASSAEPPLRLLTAAPATAGVASRGFTRGGTAAAFSGNSLPLALRPLTGASRLASRGGLTTAAAGGRPGTVELAPIVPWRGGADASTSGASAATPSATRRGRRGSASAANMVVPPALPLPLSWRLPSHLLPNLPQDQLVASTRVPLGYAVAAECRPNSVDALGRLVIRHEPLTAPLLPGRYCVSVTGFSPGSYSVSVVCGLAYGAPTVVDGAVLTAATVDGAIADAREDLTDLLTAERLGERKRGLVDGMIADSEGVIAGLGQQVATLHTALAARSIVRADLGSDDEDVGDDGGGSLADALAAARAVADEDDDDIVVGGGSGTAATTPPTGDGQAADAGAILAARRKRQRVPVDAAVEARIQTRLRKLDARLLGAVRTRETRTREARDVSDGIAQLAEARQRREAELDELLAKARQTARHLPAIVDAIGLADPASRTVPLCPQQPSNAASAAAGSGSSSSGAVSLHVQLRVGTAAVSSVGGAGRPPDTAATYARVPAGRAALPPAPYDVPQLPPAVVEFMRYGGRLLRWRAASAAERALELAPTPAGLVRRKPLADLTPDEREWMGYDRVLAPHHYDTRTDAQDPDAELDRLLADEGAGGGGGGAPPAGSDAIADGSADGVLSRLDALAPKALYNRPELLRITSVPLGQLTAAERRIRALLSRFHDNRVVEATEGVGGIGGSGSAAATASPGLLPGGGGGSDARDSATAGAGASGSGGSPQTEALMRRARKFTAEPHFHPGASPFAMARSAVPIPQRAPAGLRALLQQRGERLDAMWAALRRDPRATAVEAAAAAAAAAAARAVGGVGEDVDQRARDLLGELDRAYACDRPVMDSAALHGGREQRFAVPELRRELELELDRVLISTVTEREVLEAAIIQQRLDVNLAAARAAAADEAARLQARREDALQRMMLREAQRRAEWEAAQAASGAAARVLLTPYELAERERKAQAAAELAAALQQQQKQPPRRGSVTSAGASDATSTAHTTTTTTARPDLFLGGEYAYDSRDPVLELGGLAHWGDASKPPTPSRAAQARAAAEAARLREREALRAARDAGASPDVRARMVAVWRKRRAKALASSSAGVAAATLASLGPCGCLACMAAPCRWAPSVPVDAVRDRLREVEAELLRVRCMGGSGSGGAPLTVRSTVALSFHHGGPPVFTQADLVFELAFEAAGLHDNLRLAELDAELHSLCAATGDTVTTVALHGHPQTTGRDAAVAALRAQLAPLTARQVAEGVVDDILDWMEEGWHFGERPSELPAAGYVPSLRLTARGIGASSAAVAAHAAAMGAGQVGPAAKAAAAHAARGLQPLRFASTAAAGGSTTDNDPRTTALAALLPAQFVAGAAHAGQRRRSSIATSGAALGVPSAAAAAVSNTPHAVELRAALTGELAAQRRFDALLASDAPMVRGDSGGLQLVPHGSSAGSGGGQRLVPWQADGAPTAVSHPPPFPLERLPADTHAAAISSVAAAREVFRSALQTQAEVAASLDDGEATLRAGMFLMSLHYFKLMADLAQLREMVAGRAVVVGDGSSGAAAATTNTHKRGPDPAAAPMLSANPTSAAADRATQEACADERGRMNDTERARLKRQAALTLANAKALAGWAARAQRLAAAATGERRLATLRSRKRTAEAAAAVAIQRTWRGYRTRTRFAEYVRSLRYGETLAERRTLAAVRLLAVWRGHVARQYVTDVRAELHAFIRHVRAEERDELMEAYYEANAVRAGVDGVAGYFDRRKQARAVARVAKQRLLDDADIRARLGPGVLATAARNAARAERRGSLDASTPSHTQVEAGAKADVLSALLARRGGRVVTLGDRLALRDAVDDANVAHGGRDAGPIDLDALGDDDAYFGIRRPPKQPQPPPGSAGSQRKGSLPALPPPAPRPALEDGPAAASGSRGGSGWSSPRVTTTARRQLPQLTAGGTSSRDQRWRRSNN